MLTQLVDLARSLVARDDEDGQGLAEYALILALIAIVAIVALLFLGSQISDKLSVIGDAIVASELAAAFGTTRRAIPAGCLFPIGHLASCQRRAGCQNPDTTSASLQRTLR